MSDNQKPTNETSAPELPKLDDDLSLDEVIAEKVKAGICLGPRFCH